VGPPSEEGRKRVNKILNISTDLGVLLRVQSIEKLLEALLSSLKDGFYPWTIFRPKLLQMPFSKMHDGNRMEFFNHWTLLFLLNPIGIKKVWKISFPMPETALMLHSQPKKILLNPRASIQKKELLSYRN